MTVGLLLDDTLDRSDGVQQAVLAIGDKLTQRGHDVHYIVTETIRTDIPNIHSLGGFYSLQFNGNSVRTPKPVTKAVVDELFNQVKFDVIHVQMPYSPLFAAKVLKHAPDSVKKVGTFHILPYNFLAAQGTRLLGILMRQSIQELSVSFAVSKPAKEFMDRAFKTDGIILPNPVDYTFFNSYKKEKTKKIQLVFVGRFEERKGVSQLIEAYAALPKKMKDQTKLTMISKGPMHDLMKQKASKLGLKVNFPGFVTEAEKAQALANADVAVFPSISGESFGIVLTEAMAAGAGITIGGNNPGYASVLQDWPEVLFDPNNIDEFSELLKKCITDDAFRHKIGSKQHMAVKQYDIEKVVDVLEGTYKD
jgi:phosphatidylinositol alpha-mannosyltransferase